MHTSTIRALLSPFILFAFTTSASEVRRPSYEPTKVPLVIGGISVGVAAVAGAIVLGGALQHAGGCSAGAAFAPVLGGGGCGDFIGGPFAIVSLSALALAGVMFVLQYALSTPPPTKRTAPVEVSDADGRRAAVPPSARQAARTDVGFGFSF